MATSKKKVPSKIGSKIPGKGPHPLYGRPIRDVIARGNLSEMKRMSATARKHITDVQTALDRLDAKIKQAGG
jgi:hypothetical protein